MLVPKPKEELAMNSSIYVIYFIAFPLWIDLWEGMSLPSTGCFQFEALMSKAAGNMPVCVILCMNVSCLWG